MTTPRASLCINERTVFYFPFVTFCAYKLLINSAHKELHFSGGNKISRTRDEVRLFLSTDSDQSARLLQSRAERSGASWDILFAAPSSRNICRLSTRKFLLRAAQNKHIEINHLANKQGFTVIVCSISIINPVRMNYGPGTRRRLPAIPLLHFSSSSVTWQKYVKWRRVCTRGAAALTRQHSHSHANRQCSYISEGLIGCVCHSAV